MPAVARVGLAGYLESMSPAKALGAALLALAVGCDPFPLEDWDWNWPECDSDDECAPGAICRGVVCVEGASCSGDAQCPAGEECRLRTDDYSSVQVTRPSCETWICDCDNECPQGTVCDQEAAWSDERECVQTEDLCLTESDCPEGVPCVPRTIHACTSPWAMRNICVPLPCACDDECPAGLICDGWGCHGDTIVCHLGELCPKHTECTVRFEAPCKGTPHVRYTCEPTSP